MGQMENKEKDGILNHIDITLNINGLNTPWDKEHSTRENRKSFELNENEITFHIYMSKLKQWFEENI